MFAGHVLSQTKKGSFATKKIHGNVRYREVVGAIPYENVCSLYLINFCNGVFWGFLRSGRPTTQMGMAMPFHTDKTSLRTPFP